MTYPELLNSHVCTTPFAYLEAHKNGVYACCPSWLPVKLTSLEDIDNVLESEELKKIQESVLDGSYKYCSKTECPYLAQMLNQGVISKGFVPKDQFDRGKYRLGPHTINFAFDRSCNLSCPSCRTTVIMANGEELEFINTNIEKIIKKFGKSIKTLYLSGSADPFASKSIRKFLLNLDRSALPNLTHIHLHTNGLLLTNKMWSDLEHIHDLIKTIEISIDAANKETYEAVRRGGKWEVLLDNLRFLATVELNNKRVSFVVQDTNYLEMEAFYNLMMSIFDSKVDVYFNKITNWGTYSDAEFMLKQIWAETHPEFKRFLQEVSKIDRKYRCIHNMHDIVEKHLPKKINGLI